MGKGLKRWAHKIFQIKRKLMHISLLLYFYYLVKAKGNSTMIIIYD